MTELTVLSLGAGQDSTAISYKIVEDPEFRQKYASGRLLVLMADTGNEHPETLKHIEHLKKYYKENDIEFIHITNDLGYHPRTWPSLKEFYKSKNAIGSKCFPKTCTDKLKIQPIYNCLEDWLHKNYGVSKGRKKGFKEFADKYGKIKMLIGIAAGEERRIGDPAKEPAKYRRESIEKVYPLVEMGMDRKACHDYIKSVNQIVPPPSNCIICPWMNEIELLWLNRFMPEDMQEWIELEQNKLDANMHMNHVPVVDEFTGEITSYINKNVGVWGKKTLPQILYKAIMKYGHMTDQELQEYKMSHGHCVMSKY